MQFLIAPKTTGETSKTISRMTAREAQGAIVIIITVFLDLNRGERPLKPSKLGWQVWAESFGASNPKLEVRLGFNARGLDRNPRDAWRFFRAPNSPAQEVVRFAKSWEHFWPQSAALSVALDSFWGRLIREKQTRSLAIEKRSSMRSALWGLFASVVSWTND